MTEQEYIEEQLQEVVRASAEYSSGLLSKGEWLSLRCTYAENLAAAIARADESGVNLPKDLRSTATCGISEFARGPNLAKYSRALNDEWGTNLDIEVGPDSPHRKGPDAVGMMSPEEALKWFGEG